MRVLRMIRVHWKPLMAHFRNEAPSWPVVAGIAGSALLTLSSFLRDPAWVIWALLSAQAVYAVTFVVLGVASYRRSLRPEPAARDRHQIYTRNDIWKGRWPR